MYCKSCGQIIDGTGVFCKYCGTPSGQFSGETLPLNTQWQPEKEKKEDFVISCSEIEEEDEYTESASCEKEEHIQKLLGLGHVSYRSGEDIERSPFLTRIPVEFDDHIIKGTAGIDIDTSSIKLLQLARDRKKCIYPSLYMLTPPPKGSFRGDSFYNAGSVARIIKNFISDKNLNIDNIYFSVPPYESVTRTLILPVKEGKRFSSIIKEDISPFISFPYSKAKLDAEILCRSIPGDEGYMKILVTATNKNFINKLESIGKNLGVKFNIISAHKAMLRTLKMAGRENDNTAIINISSLNTTITIIRDGMIEQTGSFKSGFQDFITAVATGKEISLKKAREIIEHIEMDITRADEKNMKLFHIIVPSIRDWITDLIKLFSLFGSNYKLNKNNYSSLILCGEGATIKCFNTFLGNQIGIKCHNFMMPEGEMNNDFPEDYAPHFMACLGLCADNFYNDDVRGEKIEIKSSLLSSLFGN